MPSHPIKSGPSPLPQDHAPSAEEKSEQHLAPQQTPFAPCSEEMRLRIKKAIKRHKVTLDILAKQ